MYQEAKRWVAGLFYNLHKEEEQAQQKKEDIYFSCNSPLIVTDNFTDGYRIAGGCVHLL